MALAFRRFKNCSGRSRDDPAASGASEHNSGDRETIPGHQGGSVVPAPLTVHEKERPETDD
jgi:hypothetical protein